MEILGTSDRSRQTDPSKAKNLFTMSNNKTGKSAGNSFPDADEIIGCLETCSTAKLVEPDGIEPAGLISG